MRFKRAGRLAFLLPDDRFSQSPDQCFQTRRVLSFDRGRMLVTTFPSSATPPCFSASIPESTFLACYFTSLLAASSARSAFLLRCLLLVCPSQRPPHCFWPVAVSTARSSDHSSNLHSP